MPSRVTTGLKPQATRFAPASTGNIRHPRIKRKPPGCEYFHYLYQQVLLTTALDQALRQIHRYQKSFKLLIPKTLFAHCVHEILEKIGSHNIRSGGLYYRIQSSAMQALQEATEVAIIIEFESKDMILSICNNANLIYSDKPYGTAYQMHHYPDQRYENG